MDHLEKAKLALTHLAELDDLDLTGTLPPVWGRLMEIAQVQAQIAAAESLERIADALGSRERT